MTTYILTGTFNAEPVHTAKTTRQVCTDFAAHLDSSGFATYDVRAGHLASSDEWRLCIVLSGFHKQTPDLRALAGLYALFEDHVVPDTISAQWVEGLSQCQQVIPGWEVWATHGMLGCETRLARVRVLGEIY
ncbi:uncharacterized protein DSM5745_09157 [Aspergillus mulundensis]|uniref:Uncharacterized protein n=1 Tax=Aspergillus mulundensis TaxID=1810919 RepID=A0A3D8R056_9EURO|nr:hypothetical protein DSM5745_09157 [Aspergillus mulundensis]RDW67291.1 hypothetical protein DSM5745_09157 [Aspergillus mulundensis]